MGTLNKLGVGTTTPGVALDITGAGGSTTPLIRCKSNEATNSFIEFRGDGTGTEYFAGRIDVSNSDAFAIGRVGSAYDIYVNNSGNVGIGNLTNPADTLDVNGDIRIRGAYIKDAGGNARITLTDNGRLDLHEDNGAAVLSIATDGTVGIGTTGPASKLEVYDGDIRLRKGDAYPQLHLFNYGHDNASLNFDCYWVDPGGGINGWRSSDSGSNFRIYKVSDRLRISYASGVTAGSTIDDWSSAYTNCALEVDTDGNVGIGVTSPAEKLDVDGAICIKDGMSPPSTHAGKASIYVDSSDGNLKVKFGNGAVRTIVTD
jgi:hypothetical protein